MRSAQLSALLTDPLAALQRMGWRVGGAPASRIGQNCCQLGGLLVGEHARRYTDVVPRRGIAAGHTVVPPGDVQVYLEGSLLGAERLHGEGDRGVPPWERL